MSDCVQSEVRMRNPTFDVAKALMMLWVVWGHFIRYKVVEMDVSAYMLNAKIGVNMPVFFVIGGFLAHSAFQKGSWAKIAARIIGFLWPMAAFGTVFGLVLFATGEGRTIGWLLRFPLHQVLHGHWYLRTFAAIYLMSAIVYRLCRSDRSRWIAFAVLYVALLSCPGRFMSHLFWIGGQKTIHMLPYFVFGLLILNRRKIWQSPRMALICGLFFLSVVLGEGNSSTNGMNFWSVSTYWRTVFLDLNGLLCFFARTAVGLSGSIFLLGTINLALLRAPRISRLARFGTTSLGVYVLHEWPMMQLGAIKISWLPLPAWTLWLVAIGWFLTCHFAIVGIKQIPALDFFFFGSETRLTLFLQRFHHLSRQFGNLSPTQMPPPSNSNATPDSVVRPLSPTARLFWPDMLRIVAAFAVVFLHVAAERVTVLAPDNPEWWSVIACRVFPSFAVPVFFMLSGMFLLDPAREVGTRKIAHSCGRFLVAFAFWSAFYPLAFSPNRLYLGQFLKGPVHLWFLPALASCYLVAPALRAIARDRKAEKALLVVVFFLLCVTTTLRAMFNSFHRILPTTITILSMPVFLVLLGDYLHRFPMRGIRRSMLLFTGACGLLFDIVATGLLAKEGLKADFILGASHAPVVLLSAAVFTLFQSAFEKEPSSARRRSIVSEIAKSTFGIYLVHRAFIWILPAVPSPATLDIVLRSTASFASSLAVVAVLRRVPILRHVVS